MLIHLVPSGLVVRRAKPPNSLMSWSSKEIFIYEKQARATMPQLYMGYFSVFAGYIEMTVRGIAAVIGRLWMWCSIQNPANNSVCKGIVDASQVDETDTHNVYGNMRGLHKGPESLDDVGGVLEQVTHHKEHHHSRGPLVLLGLLSRHRHLITSKTGPADLDPDSSVADSVSYKHPKDGHAIDVVD